MRTASTPRRDFASTGATRRRCATRLRSSGSVRRRTPSRSIRTVACPTYSMRASGVRSSMFHDLWNMEDLTPRRMTPRRPDPALHAVLEPLGLGQRFELLERVVLDLADALARDAERLSDLLKRARLCAVEAIAELDDATLAVGQRRQSHLDVFAAERERGSIE